jgi:hypothetical protein
MSPRRFFNTAGPCKPDLHYMLPPLDRLPELQGLIEQQGYFVIHAPRQTGKTTTMMALAKQLTASGNYTAVVLSVETGAAFNHDPIGAQRFIIQDWWVLLQGALPPDLQPPSLKFLRETIGEDIHIGNFLTFWARQSPRPLVIFIDEIDALKDETLITVLRQLRAGFPQRPEGFPQSLALIGVRDVRDYKVASGGSSRLGTASPFNIKVESFTLGNFSLEDIKTLYQQHTEDTGQIFLPEAIDRIFELTQGQPWLVNAIARQLVQVVVPNSSDAITIEAVNNAKELIIQRQETHLDSLVSILQEPRVKSIFEPMLAGESLNTVPEDDRQFLVDLGLVRRDGSGGLIMANPIYQEIIPRVLANGTQDSLPSISPSWLTSDGKLDPDALLNAFLSFWKQHGEPLLRSAPYHEIAPHLVLMAFLHRVVNGSGTIDREYAVLSGRMDLLVQYGDVKMAMELKVWREGKKDPLPEGLNQLDYYLSGLGLNTGWLVIFDRRADLPPISDRTSSETVTSPQGRTIVLIRG